MENTRRLVSATTSGLMRVVAWHHYLPCDGQKRQPLVLNVGSAMSRCWLRVVETPVAAGGNMKDLVSLLQQWRWKCQVCLRFSPAEMREFISQGLTLVLEGSLETKSSVVNELKSDNVQAALTRVVESDWVNTDSFSEMSWQGHIVPLLRLF
ncbi:hypothetical protein TWF694_006674 [Orbilia ellipsospora]|uniref:Uncharacterized protein n=1 Tax=Orbilia ellipsospora TaxID=2528407 RepID=A0AAV9XSJ8_9PEZI